MINRKLGRGGPDVGVIGLGTEYLVGQPRQEVVATLHEALDNGASYIDALYAYPEYRDNVGAGLKGRRDQAVIAGHIGAAVTDDGQYRKTSDTAECARFWDDLLTRLGIDYAEVAVLQWIDAARELRQAMKPGGILELAQRLKEQGKARLIGLSCHKVGIAREAVESGHLDMLMFPVNLAWNVIPGRNELLQDCAERGVGVVAMKPYAGSRLLAPREGRCLTPAQCLSYVLDQQGITCAVPGAKNAEEMRAALSYVTASATERDYGSVLAEYQEELRGNCVYCNHCLPCPAGIDIGYTLRRLDTARLQRAGGRRLSERKERLEFYYGADAPSFRSYRADTVSASACTECGACESRCPFEVEVIAKMRQAAELAGQG